MEAWYDLALRLATPSTTDPEQYRLPLDKEADDAIKSRGYHRLTEVIRVHGSHFLAVRNSNQGINWFVSPEIFEYLALSKKDRTKVNDLVPIISKVIS